MDLAARATRARSRWSTTAMAGPRSRSPTGWWATATSPRTSSRRRSCRSGAAASATSRERGSVRTWMLGIVHHRTIDALRRNTVHDRTAPAPRASRSATRRRSGPTSRSPAARRRRRCARRSRRCPSQQLQGGPARLLRRLHAQPDRRDARHADRHREGPHATGTGEAAHERSPERVGMSGMNATSTHEQDVGAYLLGRAGPRGAQPSSTTSTAATLCRDEVARLSGARDALPRAVDPDRAAAAR